MAPPVLPGPVAGKWVIHCRLLPPLAGTTTSSTSSLKSQCRKELATCAVAATLTFRHAAGSR
jgi:hypothetical protein